jgi:hypothetical protein
MFGQVVKEWSIFGEIVHHQFYPRQEIPEAFIFGQVLEERFILGKIVYHQFNPGQERTKERPRAKKERQIVY